MILVLALLLDAALGEPEWLWSRLTHPAVLIGRAIGWADKRFNTGAQRKARGVMLAIALVLGGLMIGNLIAAFGAIPEIIAAAILLAQRSLADHVAQVAAALRVSTASARCCWRSWTVPRIMPSGTSNARVRPNTVPILSARRMGTSFFVGGSLDRRRGASMSAV